MAEGNIATFDASASADDVGLSKNPNAARPDDRAAENRRSSYRCRVSGPSQQAHLEIGDRKIAVEIVDESAGGFSVVSQGNVDCSIDQTALLRTVSNSVEVRVMNFRFLKDAASETSKDVAFDIQTRIGLMRIRDFHSLEEEPKQRGLLSRIKIQALITAIFDFACTFTGFLGLLFGALLAAVLIVLLSQELGKSGLLFNETKQDALHGDAQKKPPKSSLPQRESKPPVAPKSATRTMNSLSEQTLVDRAAILLTPEVLLKPQTLELLTLSPRQLQELNQIFRENGNAAYDAILNIFTQEQRDSLLKLLLETDAAEAPPSENEPPTQP